MTKFKILLGLPECEVSKCFWKNGADRLAGRRAVGKGGSVYEAVRL